MNLSQMRERCGDGFEILGPARLENHDLGFDVEGYANIRPEVKSYVLGVLYEITPAALKGLDEMEGYDQNPKIYDRKEFDVVLLENNKSSKVIIYFESPDNFGHPAKQDYLKEKIIEGAKENHLPEEWIELLEKFINNLRN